MQICVCGGKCQKLQSHPAGFATGKPAAGSQQTVERLQRGSGNKIPYDVLLMASPEQNCFGAATSGRCLGTQDWTVVFHDPVVSEDRIARLEQELRSFKASAAKDAVYLGGPGVVNLASQVLLFAVGQQPRPQSSTSYFSGLSKQRDSPLANFATDLGLMSASAFANLADAVITDCNKSLHYADWDSLEDAVEKCLEFVSRNPDLKKECRRECIVLESFDLIRQHFA